MAKPKTFISNLKTILSRGFEKIKPLSPLIDFTHEMQIIKRTYIPIEASVTLIGQLE